MPDEDLRELERRWAEGQGDLATGDAFSRALERAGVDVGRRLEVRLQVLRAHMRAAGFGHLTLGPQPELDPMAASFLISGEDAFRAWHALRARTGTSGAYPVIAGTEREFELSLEAVTEHPDLDPHTILACASTLAQPVASVSTSLADDRWPAESSLLTELNVIGREGPVRLALVPTTIPWHAAAFLRFRGMRRYDPDEAPVLSIAKHVVLHRSWYERYAAAPIVVDGADDLVEFAVDRPPRTREECSALWAEHACFYPGTPWVDDAPERYAASLQGANIWTLWTS